MHVIWFVIISLLLIFHLLLHPLQLSDRPPKRQLTTVQEEGLYTNLHAYFILPRRGNNNVTRAVNAALTCFVISIICLTGSVRALKSCNWTSSMYEFLCLQPTTIYNPAQFLNIVQREYLCLLQITLIGLWPIMGLTHSLGVVFHCYFAPLTNNMKCLSFLG